MVLKSQAALDHRDRAACGAVYAEVREQVEARNLSKEVADASHKTHPVPKAELLVNLFS